MTVFISVVNHRHDELITNSNTLACLAKKYSVIIKSNTRPSDNLKKYCTKNDIHLLHTNKKNGFGTNNNDVFKYSLENLNLEKNDYFLVLNPDVEISVEALSKLLTAATKNQSDISTINLFRNTDMTIYDYSIRKKPTLLNPIKTIFGFKRNDFYNKDEIKNPIEVDWASGSFLLFKSDCYQSLNGFNEKYFMYFEDADICRRAHSKNYSVVYYPEIKAVHYASFKNRKIFSRHTLWYLFSSVRYHFS
jgi:N-acetylglucosaminyl-diphospho-decaprenol L-rhamnosyltransferase